MMSTEEFILSLFDKGSVKFGTFTLQSGQTSPLYFDSCWRVVKWMVMFSLWGPLHPYALPIATIMAVEGNKGMLVRRKEAKSYGTRKLVEGVWKP